MTVVMDVWRAVDDSLASWAVLPWIVSLFVFPVGWVVLDSIGAERGRHAKDTLIRPLTIVDDFTVLVPIYGSVRYLQNIHFLDAYHRRVWLLTTTAETEQFNHDLDQLAAEHGFHVFRAPVPGRRVAGKRATSGAMRDTLVRAALQHVTTTYDVCIDADTTTVRPLGELVATLETNGIDFASLRLVPNNTSRWLGRLQEYEYRVAMRLRLVAPWLVSGACHAARTVVHRQVMAHHSLFFQGNDVEAGILAHRLGYHVAHVPFDVPTEVPDGIQSWFRQRLAWAGGEFRLFAVNVHLIRRHVWLWLYGTGILFVGLPFRWLSLTDLAWSLAVVYLLYLALMLHVHRGRLNGWVLLLPVYSMVSALAMTTMGVVWYLVMAVRDRNFGIIRLRRKAL